MLSLPEIVELEARDVAGRVADALCVGTNMPDRRRIDAVRAGWAGITTDVTRVVHHTEALVI